MSVRATLIPLVARRIPLDIAKPTVITSYTFELILKELDIEGQIQ